MARKTNCVSQRGPRMKVFHLGGRDDANSVNEDMLGGLLDELERSCLRRRERWC